MQHHTTPVKRARKASIAQIADICGVSKMTVSRALRNDPHVAEATRQRVLRVAEKENYLSTAYGTGKPNAAISRKHYYVLFQKDASLQDVYFSEVIRTIQQELFHEIRTCSLGIIDDEYGEFLRLFDMLQVGNVGGILIVGPVAGDAVNIILERFGTVVLVDNPGSSELSMPCSAVFCENEHGSREAVRHLLDMGRRRILLIVGPQDNYFSQSVIQGYEQALSEHGVDPDPSLVVSGDFHIDSGYRVTKEAMGNGITFDAVFSNDEMACGAVKAIKEAELRIPDDVSIVGFDNLPVGRAATPALTTVAVDREKLGKRAVELLLRLEAENQSETSQERVGLFPKLVIRDSCGGKGQTAG